MAMRRQLLPACHFLMMIRTSSYIAISNHHSLFGNCFIIRSERSKSLPPTRRLTQLHGLRSASSSPASYGPVVHRSQAPTQLDRVEDAINSTLSHFVAPQENILSYPPECRETVSVANNLQRRLRGLANSGDCRRCWLQRRHCVCDACVPLENDDESLDGDGNGDATSGEKGLDVHRLFLLTHHKEICLTVDTAKLILAAFPATARLVVSGIGREFQPAMGEMLDAVSNAATNNGKCLILFPTEDAITFNEIKMDVVAKRDAPVDPQYADDDEGWDVVVIDGTWSQARKIHSKYFPEDSGGCLYRVQLSQDAVDVLDADANSQNTIKGHQLRRHPIKWREISTLEATRLLLKDMHPNGQFDEQSEAMARYQEIGNDAARRQLGPPRG